MNAKFRVVRPFWHGGVMHLAGETMTIDKPADINTLMGSGRVEPANDETRARIRSKPSVEWTKASPSSPPSQLRFLSPY